MIAPRRPSGSVVSPLGSVGRLLRGSAAAATSVVKTELFRADRATDAHHRARLDTCRSCPGGHARFRGDGSLHTCGPMFTSLTREGVPTCGCVLERKARDVKQACPFGYWEAADNEAQRVADRPDVVVARVVSEVRESVGERVRGAFGLDRVRPSRRGVLAGGFGGLATLAIGRPAWAQSKEKCYVPISPCFNSKADKTHVRCQVVDGKKVGEVIKHSDDCYTIASAKVLPEYKLPENAKPIETASEVESNDCKDTVCNPCEISGKGAPKLDVTVSWTNSAAVTGIIDPDNEPNSDDETINLFGLTWSKGQTQSFCPTAYGCSPRQYYPVGSIGHETWKFYEDSNQYLSLIAHLSHIYSLTSGGLRDFPVWVYSIGRVDIRTGTRFAYGREYINSQGGASQWPGDIDGTGLAGIVISDSHFQSFDSSGLTISWERGKGTWGC